MSTSLVPICLVDEWVRYYSGMQLRIPPHLRDDAAFWDPFIESIIAVKHGLLGDDIDGECGMIACPPTSDCAEGVLTEFLRTANRRLSFLNAWEIAMTLNTHIDVVLRQLLLAVQFGSTESTRLMTTMFVFHCAQCSAECGRWRSANDLITELDVTSAEGVQGKLPTTGAFTVLPASGGALLCPLCGNLNSVGPGGLVDYARIGVYFVPVDIKQLPSLNATTPATAAVPLPLLANCSTAALSSSICLSRTFFSTTAQRQRLQSFPFFAGANFTKEFSLPRGRYMMLFEEAAIAIEIVVLTDPDMRAEAATIRNTFSSKFLLQRRRKKIVDDAKYDVVVDKWEARHGHLSITFVNEMLCSGVADLFIFMDLSLEVVAAPVGADASLGGERWPLIAKPTRPLSVPSVLTKLAGGLTNPLLVDFVPLTDRVVDLPCTFVVCAVTFLLNAQEKRDVSLHRKISDVIKSCGIIRQGGLLADATADFDSSYLVYRSPSAGLCALLSIAHNLVLSGIPLDLVSRCRCCLVEGGTLTLLPAIPVDLNRPPVCIGGSAIDVARQLASSLRHAVLCPLPQDPQLAAFAKRKKQTFSVFLASVSSAAISQQDPNSFSLWTPFQNVSGVDTLVKPLLDSIPHKFDGFAFEEEEVVLAGDISSVSCLSCPVEECLASNECLVLDDVLDPSMVDPMEISSDI